MRPPSTAITEHDAGTPQAYVSPILVQILSSALSLNGFDFKRALDRCGLALEDDEGARDWIPLSTLDKLMCESIHEAQDPGFGLVAGYSLALARFGLLTPLVLGMPNLRQAFADIQRFGPLVIPHPEVQLEIQSGCGKVICTPLGTTSLGKRFRAEMVMCGLIQMLRYVGGEQADIIEMTFSHGKPEYHERYEKSFGVHPQFDAPHTSLTFRARLLERGPMSHDRSAYLDAITKAEIALTKKQTQGDVVARLTRLLLKVGRNDLRMEGAAKLLNISERTLRRQLACAGATYPEIQHGCLKQLAERRLSAQHVSIKAVAAELGYASVSTFSCAFKAWTGYTPSAWRQAHLSTLTD